MDNNKKPSEPVEEERWEKEIGKLIQLVNLVEDELNACINEKFFFSLLLSGISLVISIFILLRP